MRCAWAGLKCVNCLCLCVGRKTEVLVGRITVDAARFGGAGKRPACVGVELRSSGASVVTRACSRSRRLRYVNGTFGVCVAGCRYLAMRAQGRASLYC